MRAKLNMNYGWKFHRGEIEYDAIRGHFATYMHSKAQSGQNAATPLFCEDDFETVDLPHDYVISTQPSEAFNASQGSYHRDPAWYRRSFELEESDRGKRMVLLFDGAGMKTEVWVNGHPAGNNESMYNSFYMDITPYLLYGNEVNTIAVHIVNDDLEGWWYEGAGLYRNVWLVQTAPIAVDVWGTYVNPMKQEADKWEVAIETTLYNISTQATVEVAQRVCDAQGHVVAENETTVAVQYGKNTFKQAVCVNNPTLWDLKECTQYKVITEVCQEGTVIDTYETPFGFREIAFTPDKGFFLNGEHVKLRGACIHQDHGMLGVAVPKSIMAYRLQKLKEAGINGYRCAHNNPAPEILELCDEMGILVIDENRWFNLSERSMKQLTSMCLRDRNHPSIIAWAVANEEPLQSTAMGGEMVRQLKEYVHTLDQTRPVTIALNGGFYDSPAANASDIIAPNYNIHNYEKMHEANPTKAIVTTESSASANTRGIYFGDEKEEGAYELSYDDRRVDFGSSYREAIQASEEREYVCGTFIWTGIDYRGEAAWPKLSSGIGILDNCAIEKDTFHLTKSYWKDEPMVHILPHWNLEGHENETISVHVYTNVEAVELFKDGVSLGVKEVDWEHEVIFDVVYTPGTLRAVGFNKGEKVAEEILTTAKAAKEVVVEVKNQVTNNGEDAYAIEAHLVDEAGHPLTHAADRIHFEVSEGAEILMVCSGDPKDHEPAQQTHKKLFGGKVATIIKVKENTKEITLTASAPELNLTTTITLTPEQGEKVARVPVCESLMEMKEFRIWPVVESRDAIDGTYNFNDMNTSQPVAIKNYQGETGTGYDLYTGKTVMTKGAQGKEMGLLLEGVKGQLTLRVFHDENCWPHPTPEAFKNIYTEINCEEKENHFIPLQGFGGNEKVNMIMVVAKEKAFEVERMYFTSDNK